MALIQNQKIARMIKDGTDNLPTGICFFDQDQNLVLCNKKMSSLIYKITGRDLQLYKDVDSLTEQIYTISDKSSWWISKHIIDDDEKYTQFVATNVTELNSNLDKIQIKKNTLTEQSEHLLQLNQNITAIVREEEILSMKMRVHNELGSSILRINQYYKNNCPQNEKAELISNLRSTYVALEKGTLSSRKDNGIEDLIRIGQSMGLDVIPSGSINFQNSTYRSIAFSAISECITNSVKHGKAQNMYVMFEENKVSITNDGVAPPANAHEGGGLSSLREKVTKSGGNMEVTFSPGFMLIVNWRTAK